jgi:hypothetical protein
MSFKEVLEPRVVEIRRLAEWRADQLHGGLQNSAKMLEEAKLEIIQAIPALEDRFRAFYELVPVDLTHIESALSWIDIGVKDGVLNHQSFDYGTTVRADLNQALEEWITPVYNKLDEYWSGPAADAFKTYLWGTPDRFSTVGGLKNVNEAHRDYATVLAMFVHAYYLSALELLAKLVAIADATISALHIHDPAAVDIWTFGGVALGILGFIPPLSVVAGIAGIALTVAQAIYQNNHEEPPKPVRVVVDQDGPVPDKIMRNAADLITKLQNDLADEDQRFGRRISEFLQSFVPRDLSTPIPSNAGKSWNPNAGNTLVADAEFIYKAGYLFLPGAASYYAEAQHKLGSLPLPAWVLQFYPRSSERYTEAWDTLSSLLIHTHDDLLETGGTLVQIAKNYVHSDQLSAQQQRELSKRIAAVTPPPPIEEPPPVEVDGRRVGGDR